MSAGREAGSGRKSGHTMACAELTSCTEQFSPLRPRQPPHLAKYAARAAGVQLRLPQRLGALAGLAHRHFHVLAAVAKQPLQAGRARCAQRKGVRARARCWRASAAPNTRLEHLAPTLKAAESTDREKENWLRPWAYQFMPAGREGARVGRQLWTAVDIVSTHRRQVLGRISSRPALTIIHLGASRVQEQLRALARCLRLLLLPLRRRLGCRLCRRLGRRRRRLVLAAATLLLARRRGGLIVCGANRIRGESN